MPDRFTRQRRLVEVGERGQERIERARARVAPGAAGVIEAAYLSRAGVKHLELADASAAAGFSHAACFRHAASRDIAHGSWRALLTIVKVLDEAQV